MTQQTQKSGYKKTLNLPRSPFSMKANLVQNEPASQKRWDQGDLYDQIRTMREGASPFWFHDGPPYANGSIHLGHLLNKVLKDFVVRSRTMMGFDVPYVPGWDCHGLPIEHQVMQELGPKSHGMEALAIRRKCRASAEKFVKLQKTQMQRLLTLADYNHPYLTMNPEYEAAVLEVFADLLSAGLIYRGLKPVHWSIENRTALAEAELEYFDRQDTSIYVFFDRVDGEGSLMIWTTTPWTLPANLAVAVHPDHVYGVYEVDGRKAVIAVELAARALQVERDPMATMSGRELIGLEYCHPFIDRVGQVLEADYVTLEDGTGLVHTAPGHGVEDYQTALRAGLEIYCPVTDDGTFDQTAPDWLRGQGVWAANDLVLQQLRKSGHLYHAQPYVHSYPHDWRSKTPVIFRATEQWFVSVDKVVGDQRSLRDRALAVTQEVQFYPDWGRNRMRGMLESRPDWCLSRQRAWGLPIPAFYPPQDASTEPLLTAASVRAVAQVVREQGSDAWFVASTDQLLQYYNAASDPDAPDWVKAAIGNPRAELQKSSDIFDVWFESGSSWHAVMRQRFDGEAYPIDLYLEGSDQHRGWFQLSLLPALGVTARAPFRSVLTHGFMVDKDGKKMSKSVGNTLEVEDLLQRYGADVCRWWVGSLNCDNDIKVDQSHFDIVGEQYRKVRNTIRFMLGNLGDFDALHHSHHFVDEDAASVDAWAMGELTRLIRATCDAYGNYGFRRAHEAVFGFCNQTMSSVYLAAVKDRLYCDHVDSLRRRRTQTTLHRIASSLIRLLAPLIPHTADEAWRVLYGDDRCVHLEQFPNVDQPSQVLVDARWDSVMEVRDQWLRGLETFRQEQSVDNPLDLGLRLGGNLDGFAPEDLADLCGLSRVVLVGNRDEFYVEDLRNEPRCERSWKRDGTVSQRNDGGWLSDRDANALGLK